MERPNPLLRALDALGGRGRSKDSANSEFLPGPGEVARANLAGALTYDLIAKAFDQTAIGLAVLSPEGEVTLPNQRFCTTLGGTPGELLGENVMGLLSARSEPESLADLIAACEASKSGHVERRVIRKDQAAIWVRMTATRVQDAHGQPMLVVLTLNDITEERNADAANRKASAFMRSVLANSPLAVYTTTAAGILTSWNRAAEKMFGYGAHETIGRLLPFVPDAHREEVLRRIERAAAGESQLHLELEHVRADRSLLHVNASLSPLVDGQGRAIGAVGMCVDITEARRAQAALRASEARFRRVTESAQDVVAIVSPEGIVTYASSAVETMLGLSAEELIGQSVFEHVHAEDIERLRDRFAAVVDGTGQREALEFRHQHKDGAWRWFEALATNCLDEPAVNGVVINLRDVTERKSAQEKVLHLAYHDTLTGLPNRTLLQDRIGQAIARTRRRSRKLAVMFIDLDNFKHVNDTMGHDMGDLLLKQAAARLQASVRAQDTIARQGGDEFIVLVEDLVDGEGALTVAQKIQGQFREPIRLPAGEAHVSASIGIALFPDDAGDAATLLKNADTAMFHSKAAGKNTYQFFTPQMNIAVKRRALLESALRKAIPEQEFEVYFQPQVWLPTRTPIAIEALLRWRREGSEVAQPSEFIPVAEDAGLMPRLGELVLNRALAVGKLWRDRGASIETVCVNVAGRELMESEFVQKVAQTLAAHDLPADFLELEINESQLMRRIDWIMPSLRRLREMGVHLCIDDFGSGYSSLGSLQRLPVERLKISQSFVRDMTFDKNNEAIVAAIVSMSKNLGMDAVAEGVETEAQAERLLALGCTIAQGFLFAEPRAELELEPGEAALPQLAAQFLNVPALGAKRAR
jgi:diguanylate cyclase (GGDEF)-like protein/PAS domain S-box-containing protein